LLSKVGWQTIHSSAGARTGAYAIVVVDTSGNRSIPTWQRTTIATLPDVNVVEFYDDTAKGHPGSVIGLVKTASSLTSEGNWGNVVPFGYYSFEKSLDLGDVYEARISSKIEAHGISSDELMVNWKPLAIAIPLTRTSSTRWDAWLEVRSVDRTKPMSQWVPSISTVSPLSASGGGWTPWRPVQVGDFTGRFFQFRIVTQSKDPDVKVVVTKALVEIDMPDRTDYGNDIDIPVTGKHISFNPQFRVTPAIAITIEGNASAATAVVTNKDHNGFDLKLIDSGSLNPVAGRVDWMAEGYGRKGIQSI